MTHLRRELMLVVSLHVRSIAHTIIVLPALLVSCSFKIRRCRFCLAKRILPK